MAWIGVDFDGTLAVYDPLNYPGVGPPVPKMLERVKQWLAQGTEVKIITARASPNRFDFGDTVDDQVKVVQDWTEKYLGVRLEVQAHKDYGMLELWDDRAIQVVVNTGERVG